MPTGCTRHYWRTHLYIVAIAVVAVVLQAPSSGQPTRELLNSERIAAAFGSYGVEVVEQDDEVRVSNLFSRAGEEKICRTFAVVRYTLPVDSAITAAHAAIVAGGSIGAAFAARGWEVRKSHLRYSERPATPKLASLMRVAAGAPLAEHTYVLDVVKDGRAIEYAALVEIHHPDYLGLDDLKKIYGAASDDRNELVAQLLATATERAR